METPTIRRECVETLLDKKFIRVFDLQYREGKHYYDATRRSSEDIAAVKSDEEFKAMLPDAVTCIVIVQGKDTEPKLLLSYEFRYPAGRFLLSPPAGLIDAADKEEYMQCFQSDSMAALEKEEAYTQALLNTAQREIREETGIVISGQDRIFVVNPLLFSSPGMTDESNALVCAVITPEDLSSLSQDGAEGSECFDGFSMLTKEEAAQILRRGRDEHGIFYSVYTWAAMYFVSGMWEYNDVA